MAEVTEEAAVEGTEVAGAEVTAVAGAEVAEETDFFFSRGAGKQRKAHCTLSTMARGLIRRFTPSISFGTLKLISNPAGALRSRMYVSVCE
jgi:hypothetical protein